MASQDARLTKFEADFKQQQSKMTNKIDTVFKAITDRIAGALPSDTVKTKTEYLPKSLELGKNGSAFVQGEVPAKMKDLGLFTLPCRLEDSKPFDTLADLGSCINIIPLYLFKKLKIRLLEETDHIFGLANRTKSYPVKIEPQQVHSIKIEKITKFPTHTPTITPEILKPIMVHKVSMISNIKPTIYRTPHQHLNSNLKMPILHSFEKNKLEYEDEDEVKIKMMETGMDKESLEHNLYENDIT
ncbi:hypothetical protein Tco_0144567 [Tanacetum coccineum]